MESPKTEYRLVDGDEAILLLDVLSAIYSEVYQEPPYGWGQEHLELFQQRFAQQAQQPGFSLAVASGTETQVGFVFGFTLPPTTSWWQNLLTDVDASVTTERIGRTFALIELLVCRQWRRQGIATKMHDMLLRGRPEERATLTALPAAEAAQRAYAKWGWHKVARKHNPLPDSPLFDVLVKDLGK